MIELPEKPLIAYMSYPFSKNPKQFTKEVCKFAKEIMLKHPNIFVIVPHTAVDYTMYGPPRKHITDYGQRDHTIAAQLEFSILWNIDIFIQGVPDDPMVSMGCIWEHSFAHWLNTWRKKQILIVPLKEILEEK
jgi:hypothetical protein